MKLSYDLAGTGTKALDVQSLFRIMKRIFVLLTSVLLVQIGIAQKEVVVKKKDRRKDVLLQTSMGDILVRLSDSTPLHRDNFLKLVKQGFYDSVLFHRVIKNFMI